LAATAVQGAAVAPAARGPQEGRDYLVEAPDALWRGPRWPVVVALAPADTEFASVAAGHRGLTRERGALLLVVTGGDDVRLQTVLNAVAARHPVLRGQVYLLARDALAVWAWRQVLGKPGQYAGVMAIDSPVPDPIEPVPGQAATTPGKACLLVTMPERLAGNRRLEESLVRWGLTCVCRQVPPEALAAHLGTVLTAILPPTPARSELTDPVTGAHLRSPAGWHFERRDGLLALARTEDPKDPVLVEIVTGKLGKRSFEGYVEHTRQFALAAKDIVLLDSARLTPANAAIPIHAFHAVDRRGGAERGLYWLLVGSGDRLVSLRGVGQPELVAARLDELRALAQAVTFE
jgi:hypothetical protein